VFLPVDTVRTLTGKLKKLEKNKKKKEGKGRARERKKIK
jgi:hypothetical protein